jgi:hypothetical protein
MPRTTPTSHAPPGLRRRPHVLGGLAALITASLALEGAVALADDGPPDLDRITLAEILPELAGTDLGALDLGPAPPPGQWRTVRRSDVLRALASVGRDARGLALPRVSRIRREVRVVSGSEVEALLRPAIDAALGACRTRSLDAPRDLRLGSTAPEVYAETAAPRASGRIAVLVRVVDGGRTVRMVVPTEVECPAPVVAAGARVRIVVTVGAVRVTAPGQALQAGRVGDEIQVANLLSRARLTARVLDPATVEVLR